MENENMLSELLMKLEEKYQDDPDVAQLSELLAEDVDNESMDGNGDNDFDDDMEMAPAIDMAEEPGEMPADFDALASEDLDLSEEDEDFDLADPPVPVTGTNAKKKKKFPLA